MELQTRLLHIHSEAEFNQAIEEHPNVMICCGRMGPMCVPVYSAMEILRDQYQHVQFYDMPFDHPDAHVIRQLPECRGFMGLPFTVYFKNGTVVNATTSVQSQDQIESILNANF
jgi:thioredoxin 1